MSASKHVAWRDVKDNLEKMMQNLVHGADCPVSRCVVAAEAAFSLLGMTLLLLLSDLHQMLPVIPTSHSHLFCEVASDL